MPNPYSGLGNILENFVLPMVRKGNLTKDELSRLNDSAIQARRSLTDAMMIIGKGFIHGDQAEIVGEHFLHSTGNMLIAMAESIESLAQIEQDSANFRENTEAMKVLYAALKPKDCQETTH